MSGGRALDLFVPGRVCLMGEHSDWAGGWRRDNPAIAPGRALLVGTREGIHARVEPCPGWFRWKTPEGRVLQVPFRDPDLLTEARSGGYLSYAAGVAYQVRQRFGVDGIQVDNHRTDLPVRKGLSSSAAVCVLVARAFNRLYDLDLSLRDEMDLAYQGERTTPSRCGRLDQGCAFGDRVAVMTFDGDGWDGAPVPVKGTFHMLVVDLCASKDTRRILHDLNACYPFPPDPVARGVHEALGPLNRARVGQAEEALARGDGPAFGALLTAAQADFDRLVAPACPEELLAPVLHRVLSHPELLPLVWGGKGVGSQGDGAAQFLARDAKAAERAVAAVAGLGMRAFRVEIMGGV